MQTALQKTASPSSAFRRAPLLPSDCQGKRGVWCASVLAQAGAGYPLPSQGEIDWCGSRREGGRKDTGSPLVPCEHSGLQLLGVTLANIKENRRLC